MNKDLLRNIPLFSGLQENDLEELSTSLQHQTYAPQEPIFWIGELGDNMYIIQNGRVHLSYPDDKGQDIILASLGPGAFFGELSVLDGGPRTATARAHTDTTLFSLNRQALHLFLEKYPRNSLQLISTLASRLRESTAKLRGIVNVNAEVEENLTPLQRLVDKAAGIGANVTFLIITIIFIIGWMGINTYLVWHQSPEKISLLDEPPTFFWLGLMVSLTSFLLTILVLNSQRRQAERDRIRAEIEYQVNLKAQLEVMQLQNKMDKVIAALNNLPEASNSLTASTEIHP